MNKTAAYGVATGLLHDLIKNQPQLFHFSGSAGPAGFGKEAATFCTEFIDTYAEWLVKREER
jgi:hypothetical protein